MRCRGPLIARESGHPALCRSAGSPLSRGRAALAVRRTRRGVLSDQALSPDGADAVRHLDLIFTLLRIVPGNIADILFSSAGMINPADKAQIEKDLGLDQPIVIQYAQWISGLFQRRSRLLLHLREADLCGDRAAPADQRQARRHGARLRGPVRHSARRDLGGAAEHAARLRAARRSASPACRCRRSGSASWS